MEHHENKGRVAVRLKARSNVVPSGCTESTGYAADWTFLSVLFCDPLSLNRAVHNNMGAYALKHSAAEATQLRRWNQ